MYIHVCTCICTVHIPLPLLPILYSFPTPSPPLTLFLSIPFSPILSLSFFPTPHTLSIPSLFVLLPFSLPPSFPPRSLLPSFPQEAGSVSETSAAERLETLESSGQSLLHDMHTCSVHCVLTSIGLSEYNVWLFTAM